MSQGSIGTFILKVASRCNLNCTYCFVYNRGDESWRDRPKLMSEETVRVAAERMAVHCAERGRKRAQVVFHGGEPMIGGAGHLSMITGVVREAFARHGVVPMFGMQSNGLLFDDAIGEVCLRERIGVGISLDGPPEINDKYRLDLQGRPSTARLEKKLRLLGSPRYRRVFGGFLVVVDVASDPVRTFDYLAQFAPPAIDFILPYDHHDRLPPGKASFEDESYGRWMTRLFDHWYAGKHGIELRQFDSFLRLMFGGRALVESTGLDAVGLVVVETDGAIEAVDSLKATYPGAPSLGLDVRRNDFDEALEHPAVNARRLGLGSVSAECRACPLVKVCGGGYVPNRYSEARGFDNPSVYCRDLAKLVRHMHGAVVRDLEAAGALARAPSPASQPLDPAPAAAVA